MAAASVPPIVLIYQLALDTFADELEIDTSPNFKRLKRLMDNLKADDLNLDQRLKDPETWKSLNKAPCTYIEVFKNNKVNMSILALKPGFKMPLHDHPHMHGLLKVISGKVEIKSFSEFPSRETPYVMDYTAFARTATRRVYVQHAQDFVGSVRSETCVMTPSISNYHEIEVLDDSPAALFKVLSQPNVIPPYTTIEDTCLRRSKFYYPAREISTAVVELKEKNKPHWFYYDKENYSGPTLMP